MRSLSPSPLSPLLTLNQLSLPYAWVLPWEVSHSTPHTLMSTPPVPVLTIASTRGLQCTSYQWWSILLGRHAFQATERALRVLGHWLVQFVGTGRRHDWYQVRLLDHTKIQSIRTVLTRIYIQLRLCQLYIDSQHSWNRLRPHSGQNNWYLRCCARNSRSVH